jgi:hypothetical protein
MNDPSSAGKMRGAGANAYQTARQDVESVSFRGVIIGLLLFSLLAAGTFVWRITSAQPTRAKLPEFEFSVQEPDKEKFELKEPLRDILKEKPEEMVEEVQVEEKPDIHMTVTPTEVEVTEEVIQSRNIEVETPLINPKATEIEIDAPEEISQVQDSVQFALQPIAAASPSAEIFQYKKPSPPEKMQRFWVAAAPKASRSLTAMPKQFGDQDAPSMGELGPMNINLFGNGDFFRSMTRFGGVHARSAVDSALHWLAVHQETEGFWDPKKHEGNEARVGITGLAVLAFMGGGHTARRGEYRRNVLRCLEWLLSQQKENGSLGATMYEQAIATIALCEAFGRVPDERVGLAARKAVMYLEKAVNRDDGWRYHPNSPLSDVSVTGWVIQALKTARLAQIQLDRTVYSRALVFLDSLTDRGAGPESNGGVGYTFVPEQNYGAGMPAMTCAGMVIRQFSGVGVKTPILIKGAELTRRTPPSWGAKDFYLWYYATYAMHNMGEENRIWWNRRIRDVLVEHQCRDGDKAGSWDPDGDRWASHGGRVYTTALGALCLEVYYRYSEALNSFGVAPDLDDLLLQ